MDTINRHAKFEHLNAVSQPVRDLYLTPQIVRKNQLFANDETAAYHYKSILEPPSGSKQLYDFEDWLHNADEAKALLDADAKVMNILPAYGEAIKREHAFVEDYILNLCTGFGLGLDDLAAKGHIPTTLADRFHLTDFATSLKVGIADSSFEQEAGAFYWPAKNTMYFRPWSSVKQLTQRFTHESFHHLSGTTTVKQKGQIYSSRLGLGMDPVGENGYVNGSMQRHRAINEGRGNGISY
jgi:hypothetical protein